MLSEFIDKGYTMLKGAIPADVIDKARFDLARAYLGCYNELRFDSYTDRSDQVHGGPPPMMWPLVLSIFIRCAPASAN